MPHLYNININYQYIVERSRIGCMLHSVAGGTCCKRLDSVAGIASLLSPSHYCTQNAVYQEGFSTNNDDFFISIDKYSFDILFAIIGFVATQKEKPE